MAILYDARGNELVGSLDIVGGQTFTDARTSSGTLSALNAELVMDLNGSATAVFDVRATTANLTVVFEGTVDGTNYVSLPGFNPVLESYLSSIVITTAHGAAYLIKCSGFRRIRARVSAFTSGSVVVTGRASRADSIVYAKTIPSNLHVTVTAAANTGATITLPAAGAGLFHYITNIHLCRNATAALAGTATLVITSTNLPGSPAWSVGNAMAAGGTQIDLDYRPTTPLKSSVANTATTVVMPVPGAAVLWRGNCTYYVGA